MCGQIIAVIHIGGAVGIDRLPLGLEGAKGFANRLQIGLAAAHEQVEIENDGLDIVIDGRAVNGLDHVPNPDLRDRRLTARQQNAQPAFTRLIDQCAFEVENKGTARWDDRRRSASGCTPQADKHQQQQDQRQPVLDPDQHTPKSSEKPHPAPRLTLSLGYSDGSAIVHQGCTAKECREPAPLDGKGGHPWPSRQLVAESAPGAGP